jgi:uncharacterized membrane protein
MSVSSCLTHLLKQDDYNLIKIFVLKIPLVIQDYNTFKFYFVNSVFALALLLVFLVWLDKFLEFKLQIILD